MFFNVDIVLNLCDDVFGFHIGQIPRLTIGFSLKEHYDCKVIIKSMFESWSKFIKENLDETDLERF